MMSNGGGSLECTVEGVKEGSPAMVAVVRKHGWANLVEVQVVGAEQTARFERLAPTLFTPGQRRATWNTSRQQHWRRSRSTVFRSRSKKDQM